MLLVFRIGIGWFFPRRSSGDYALFQTPDGQSRYNNIFHLLQLLGMVTLILTIIGISVASSSSSSSSANIMRRTGVILFAVLYITFVGICLFLWTQVRSVMPYRKQLLTAISIALPLLAVRMLYSILFTFSSSTFAVSTTSSPQTNTSDPAKFNIFPGEWQIYFVMDMLMEFAVVVIFAVSALVLRLNQP